MSSSGWREVKLGDHTVVKGGKRLPKGVNLLKEKNNHPYIRVRDLNNTKNLNLNDDFEYIDDETQKTISRYIVNTDDIVISIVGTIGLISKVGISLNNANLTENCVKLVDLFEIDSDYIYYYLISEKGQNEIRKGTVGAVQAKLPIKNIQAIRVTLPTVCEQRAIASTLSCLDDKIELNNLINKTLEAMAQAIFKSWFVDFEPFQEGEFEESELGEIPKGWRVVELGSISKFIKGKKPAELLIARNSDSQEQYLTIDVLNGGKPQFANVEKMVMANEFDILMVMDGASSGTVYFGLKGIIASTIGKVEVKNEQLREVVYQYLKINEVEVKNHNTGSAIPHTDKGFVSRCKIAIPPEKNLKEISDTFIKIRESMLNNMLQVHVLTTIRDSILPKLMSGEIRVPIKEVQ